MRITQENSKELYIVINSLIMRLFKLVMAS